MGQALSCAGEDFRDMIIFMGYGLTRKDAMENLHYQVIGRLNNLEVTLDLCNCTEESLVCPYGRNCTNFISLGDAHCSIYMDITRNDVHRASIAVSKTLVEQLRAVNVHKTPTLITTTTTDSTATTNAAPTTSTIEDLSITKITTKDKSD